MRLASSDALVPPESVDVPGPASTKRAPISDADTQPSARPASLPPRQPANKAKLFVAFLGLATGFVVLIVGIMTLVGAIAMYQLFQDMADQVSKMNVPSPTVQEVKIPTGPNAQFISLLANTRKMSVRCDGGRGDGSMEATVVGAALGTCTVTALYDGRQRKTATIPETKSARYKCFRNGQQRCELAVP
jgi:hypothetical protein